MFSRRASVHVRWTKEMSGAVFAARPSDRTRGIMTEDPVPFASLLGGLAGMNFLNRLTCRTEVITVARRLARVRARETKT